MPTNSCEFVGGLFVRVVAVRDGRLMLCAMQRRIHRLVLVRIGAVIGSLALVAACVSTTPVPPRPGTGGEASRPYAPSREALICRQALMTQGVSFVPMADLLAGSGCASSNAISLRDVPGDFSRIAVANVDRIACPLSQAVAAWARYGVDRAARQILGSGLARIETFGAYSCRNVAGTPRRSAHANANALDVSAFVLADGRRITVKDDWNGGTEAERRFLRVVHASACKRFGTVLGPEYNAAHTDHLHVEAGDGSFCR